MDSAANIADEQNVQILSEIETLPFSDALQVFKQLLDEMGQGACLEFQVTDFDAIVQYFLEVGEADAVLVHALAGLGYRKMFWQEKTIAKELLQLGFYRVWTGKTSECSQFGVWVKALKFTP